MFEQAFKNIDDVFWKEAGCTTELDYIEQDLDAESADVLIASASCHEERWEECEECENESEGKNPSPDSHSPHPIIPPRGDYQTLLSYQKAEVIYDLTFRFAHKFLTKSGPHHWISWNKAACASACSRPASLHRTPASP